MNQLNLIKFKVEGDILTETPHVASDNFKALFDLEFESVGDDPKKYLTDKLNAYADTGIPTHKGVASNVSASVKDRVSLLTKLTLPSEKKEYDINQLQIGKFIGINDISKDEWNEMISNSLEKANA